MGLILPGMIVVGCITLVIGLVVAWRLWRRHRRRILCEDVLKQVSSASMDGRSISPAEVGGQLGLPLRRTLGIVQDLESAGLLHSHGGVLELTDEGERSGLKTLRGHRLLERYLFDEARLPLDRLHAAADRAEHGLKSDDLEALTDHLGHPATDPHGDVIPTGISGRKRQDRTRLSDWPLHVPAEVVHVEDKPREALVKVTRAGLLPGAVVSIDKHTADAIIGQSPAGEFSLPPAIAAKVNVRAADEAAQSAENFATLAELPLDEEAEIVTLSAQCTGLRRRRLLDLGFTQGAKIRAVLSNAGDEAHAYSIRDTLIALRDIDASQVLIRPLDAPASAEPAIRGAQPR